MNSVLRRVCDTMPRISNIAYYSRDQINRKSIPAIDEVIRDTIEVASNAIEYLGIRKMGPQEAYESMASSSNTIDVDVTMTSFSKVVLEFKTKADNSLIRIKLGLPYLDRYGVLICNDINYSVKPVFTDNVLSPYSSGIFVKLYILKTNISSIPISVYVNNNLENMSVIFPEINKSIKGDSSSVLSKAVSPLAFYGLATRGLTGLIKEFFNYNIKIVNTNEYDHNEKSGIYYRYPTLPVGFVVECDERVVTIDNIISSVFYILDRSNSKAPKELMLFMEKGDVESEKAFWTFIFGRFFYKGSLTEQKSTSEIITHLDRVKNFLDSTSKHDLRASGIFVNDFVELSVAILGIFNGMVLKYKEISSNIVQNKKLNVLYYILNSVIINANSGLLEISKREKNRGVSLSTKEIEKILNDSITERLVMRIVKSTKKNLAINTMSCCTDNTLDVLLISDDQNRGEGVNISSKKPFPSILRTITPEHNIVGDMHNIGKKAPTQLLRINPFAEVDVNNQFIIDPKLLAITEDVSSRMRALKEYNNYDISEEYGASDELDD